MSLNRAKWAVTVLLIGGAAAGTVAGCYRTVYVYEYADGRRIESTRPIDNAPEIEVTDLRADGGADGNTFTGKWQGFNLDRAAGRAGSHHSIRMTIGDARGQHAMLHVAQGEIVGSLDAPAGFDIRREAGLLRLNRPAPGASAGDATLSLDPAFGATIAELTGQPPTPEQKLRLFRSGVTLTYVRVIKEAGYTVTLDELVELRNSGVSSDYIAAARTAGYAFKPRQLINLSRNGISRSYMVGLREAGFELNDEQLIKLSRNGISQSYARDLKAAGYGDIDDIIELSRNGVSASYAKSMGFGGKRPAKGVIDLSRNGVSAGYGKSLADLGYELTDADLVNLGRNGVSASYAKSMREAGYTFTANDLVELNRNGIGADYARRVKAAGYHLGVGDLITLSRNGVSSSFIASLHDPKKPNLSVDAIVDLSRKGVDAATVKKIRGM